MAEMQTISYWVTDDGKAFEEPSAARAYEERAALMRLLTEEAKLDHSTAGAMADTIMEHADAIFEILRPGGY
jgi:hypothetical protein